MKTIPCQMYLPSEIGSKVLCSKSATLFYILGDDYPYPTTVPRVHAFCSKHRIKLAGGTWRRVTKREYLIADIMFK